MPKRNPTHIVTPPDTVKAANRRAAAQRHDARRGSASERGYGHQWQKHAKAFLADYPWCIACVDPTSKAVLVDHIVPALQSCDEAGTKDPLFFARWNHQPLCRMHHDRKTRHDETCSGAREYALSLTGDECVSRDLLLRHIRLWPRWVDLSWRTECHQIRGWSLVD